MSVPLSFEPNQGQLAAPVQFLSRGSGYALFLTPGEVVLNLERQQPASAAAEGQTPEAPSVDTLRMSLIGADPKVNAVGLARQPGVVSYFIGNDPKVSTTIAPGIAANVTSRKRGNERCKTSLPLHSRNW
jgi:hypothetical protein